MFYTVMIPPRLALRLTEVLTDYVEHNLSKPYEHLQSVLHVAHCGYVSWYQSRNWIGAGDSDEPKQMVMCEDWLKLVLQVLTERLREDQSNEELQGLFRCFSAAQKFVPGKEKT